MKLLLLPLRELTSKKVFLYASAITNSKDIKPSIPDRIVNKASTTWMSWEAATGGWKKRVVTWGNKAVSKIDYREHALKSIMSRSAHERYFPNQQNAKIHLGYPAGLPKGEIVEHIQTLAKEGRPRHQRMMIYSFLLMPITIPFALVPIVPNLPFFYVAFRAWSHYRAMMGSSHLQSLISEDRIAYTPSKTLDDLYDPKTRTMIFSKMKDVLQTRLPEMAVEVERASAQLDRIDAKAQASDSGNENTVSPMQGVDPKVPDAEVLRNKARSRTGLHR